jgi:hypothetical protein
MFIIFQKICAITEVGKTLNYLSSLLAALIDLLLHTKPRFLTKLEPTATQHLNFFSDNDAEFTRLNDRACFGLGLDRT